ncbi:MAG TPA: HTTM domain-containing protein [Myxococcota bacterium]
MIGFCKRQWQRFVATLSTVEDGAALALMRIAAGFALLVLVVPFVVSDAGAQIVGFVFVDDEFGGYRDLPGTEMMRVFGGPNPTTVSALLITSLIAGICMVLGVFGRAPVLVAAVATRVVFGQNPDVSGGGDALLGNVLFLLLLGDCTHTLSLDCWWRTRRLVDETLIPAWPRKLALVQLAIMYTATGLQKLVSTTWTPLDGFSALYQILQSPQWARFPWLIEAADGWLVVPMALGTLITIVWECSFWLVLVKRSWRWGYAVVGVGIHIGIIVLMEVGIFSWLSMALYPAMFPLAAAQLARWIGAWTDPLPSAPPRS